MIVAFRLHLCQSCKNLIEVRDSKKKNISSSGCTGGSAELVSDPNNILFSNNTYRFLMFLLLMLHSIRRRHIGGTQVTFKVVEMEEKYLKQRRETINAGFI